jgi:uncharacterized protein
LTRRSPVAFLLLTFALAVPFWLLGAGGQTLSTGPLSVLPSFLPVSALQAVCPLVAALILVCRTDTRAGVVQFLKRTVDPTTGGRNGWYLPAICLPPLVMGASYWIMGRMGTLVPEQSVAYLSIPVLFALYAVAAVFEEGGWTAYATDPLQARWGALTASLILGSAGALFHVVPLIEAGRALPWIGGWFVGTVAQRVLIVWLYNNAGRSVLPTILFHATLNVSESVLPNNGAPDAIVSGTLLAVAAAVVVVVWGPATLARPTYAPIRS